MSLDGTVAVVTGGGSGIGRAIAEALHHEGARVVIGDVSGAQDEVCAELGDGAVAAHANVTAADDMQGLMDTATSTFGRLDVMVNNAGIDGAISPVEHYQEADFDRVLAVNVKGTFLGCKLALPALRASGGGSIVNIASVSGLVGMPMLGPYCASKGAIIALTRAVAIEGAPDGIRANAICPGPIDTPRVREIAATNPAVVEGRRPRRRWPGSGSRRRSPASRSSSPVVRRPTSPAPRSRSTAG